MSKARAADALKPDSEGYIRDWVMLAPIALPEGDTGADLILKEQIKDEAALQPKAGDKVKINGKELTWQNITASTNYFDFNAILKTVNDHAAGYMVTYIECDKEMPDVTMAVGQQRPGTHLLQRSGHLRVHRSAPAHARRRQGEGHPEEGRQRHRVQNHQRTEQLAGSHALSG